jgi:hypothetical protein
MASRPKGQPYVTAEIGIDQYPGRVPRPDAFFQRLCGEHPALERFTLERKCFGAWVWTASLETTAEMQAWFVAAPGVKHTLQGWYGEGCIRGGLVAPSTPESVAYIDGPAMS